MRPWIHTLVAALTATGCSFDADYGGTSLRCPPASPRCPDGHACVNQVCTAGGAGIDAATDGIGPDAGVCELAAMAPANDGCGAAIDLTAAALVPGGTIAYGNTTGYASDLTPSTLPGCTESPEPGADAIYRLTLAAADSLAVTLSPQGWIGHIYVINACNATASCIGGGAAFAQVTETIATAGTYYVVVDAPTAAAAGCFSLAVTVTR